MTTNSPCDTFAQWAEHADTRIQAAGLKLKASWCREAYELPALRPLTAFVARAVNERWPDPATAGAMLHDLHTLAAYIGDLEAR